MESATREDPSETIQMTSTWIAKTPRKRREERSEERNDYLLQIAQSVRRTSMRYSTAALDTYFFLKYMKIRPLILLIRQDLSHLVIRAVYLHMPLPNMEC
jgi:hypothetical protein